MNLSEQIRAAQAWHKRAYPNGDWRDANEELGRLVNLSVAVLSKLGIGRMEALRLGNEGRARKLDEFGL